MSPSQAPPTLTGTPRHGVHTHNGTTSAEEPGLRLEDLRGDLYRAPGRDRRQGGISEEPGLKLEDLLAQTGEDIS